MEQQEAQQEGQPLRAMVIPQFWVERLLLGHAYMTDSLADYIALPEGTQIVRTYDDPLRMSLVVILTHPSFDLVTPGEPIPIFHPRIVVVNTYDQSEHEVQL